MISTGIGKINQAKELEINFFNLESTPKSGSLYIATLAAIRRNRASKGFYQRLIAAGKCHKVAATACMRKLLIIVNAMLRDQTLWQQN